MLCTILSLALRVFFRRVEVHGLARVPREGAIVFVLNHPNGLIDPVFVLCHAPRDVSFLAKEPLFRMPIIGQLVRALEAIPIYRRQDEGADVSRNRETFARCRALLKRGGTIAICPEGVSHNEPQLRPLKTGVARIALGVMAEDPALALKIVPAGLYYTAKTTFRSGALLYFGEPLAVEAVAPDTDGEPPREAVQSLSDRIARALRDVTLNAEHEQALSMVARAERIFSAESDEGESAQGESSLARKLELRRRFLESYAFHFRHSPARLSAFEARIRRYEEELREAGVDPEDLSASQATPLGVARFFLTRVLPTLCLFPLACIGVGVHYPTYRLAGFFATKFSREQDDVVSTIKIIASMLLFPVTWAALVVCGFALFGWTGAAVALLLAPLSGYVAIYFFEELDRFVGAGRALLFFFTRRRFFTQLLVERRRLREEMFALAAEAARETR